MLPVLTKTWFFKKVLQCIQNLLKCNYPQLQMFLWKGLMNTQKVHLRHISDQPPIHILCSFSNILETLLFCWCFDCMLVLALQELQSHTLASQPRGYVSFIDLSFLFNNQTWNSTSNRNYNKIDSRKTFWGKQVAGMILATTSPDADWLIKIWD